MNELHKGIITLMKSAVTQEKNVLPPDFSLEQALPLIRKHNILTLAYDGAVRCGISAQDSAMVKMFPAYCKAMMVSEGQIRMLEQIFRVFDREGIDYLPLKGCTMKGLYPRHELRPMGDADILIRTEQYDRIKPLISSLGFEEKMESDHELVWRSPSLLLELHKRLIPSYNQDFYAYYGDGWKLAKIRNGTRFSMTPEDEWIYLFTHFAKHYRDGGIGCRHVLDLWMWRRACPEMDEEYIAKILKELQLDVFHGNMLRLLKMWFEDGAGDCVMEIISEFIFSSGSFGVDEMRVLSRAVRDEKNSGPSSNGKIRYLWQTAFPGVQVLRNKYTILKKYPWMLPGVWIVRPVYKIMRERKSLDKQVKCLEALTKENLDLRRELLDAVGLKFNF